MNTYITWSITLFALYVARKRSNKGADTKEKVKNRLLDFHLKSSEQKISMDELPTFTEELFNFIREKFADEFSTKESEWVVNDYDSIKDIVIGQFVPENLWYDTNKNIPVNPQLTIDKLLNLIETLYLIPCNITDPTPADFKNLDMGGNSQIKVFLEHDTSEFQKRNQFIYIITGGEYRDRIFGATMLQKIHSDISFIAIDPRFEALFTMLSPLEAFSCEDHNLLNSVVVAAGSKDNHLGYLHKISGEVRFSSIINDSVFKVTHDNYITKCIINPSKNPEEDSHYWWHGDQVGWCNFQPERTITSTPCNSCVEKVSCAMLDIMKRRTDEIDSPGYSFTEWSEISSDVKESHPVEHIILAGNSLFAFDVEKIRANGVIIPLECIEFADNTLKRLLSDKKQEIWDSDAWDTFDWLLTQINMEMGESMVQIMINHNTEIARKPEDCFLDISIFIKDMCPLGKNLDDIFKALKPYQYNNFSEICVKSIRAMPRVTPKEITDPEIHRILGKLSTVCGCSTVMEE